MSETPLTIVAKIEAHEGKGNMVKTELLKLIAPTRAENGCINYDLHQDTTNDHLFLFYENWASRELWQQHMKSPHIVAHQKATAGLVKKVEILEMKPVG